MTDEAGEFIRSFDSGYPDGFLSEYHLEKCLAHGSGGETLVVRKKADDELYIAKIQKTGSADEGELLEALSHPGIPRFEGRFSGGGVTVAVREYVDGAPLDEVMDGAALTVAQAVSVGVKLCDILTYLHTRTPPVIHRDIKPQNVILCRDGSVKLIDFGISRTYKPDAGHDTVFSGTSEFAPPEQYGFGQTDARADIYSLGMLMRFLLTGGDAAGTITDRRVARIVARCTAFAPKDRYGSAAAVKRALLADSPARIRRRAAVAAAAMLLIGIAIGRFAIPYAESRAAHAQALLADAANEYARAHELGVIPEELFKADPDDTVVTWKQYCEMLGGMISAYNEKLLPEWEHMTAAAPDTEMKRDGGMVSLLFAAELMGLDSFNAGETELLRAYAPKVWENVTMDYPVFDFMQPKDITRDCYDNNYVGPSYDFCLRRVSKATGKSLLEFDKRGDLRLSAPFTLREAAQAALRLYESAD